MEFQDEKNEHQRESSNVDHDPTDSKQCVKKVSPQNGDSSGRERKHRKKEHRSRRRSKSDSDSESYSRSKGRSHDRSHTRHRKDRSRRHSRSPSPKSSRSHRSPERRIKKHSTSHSRDRSHSPKRNSKRYHRSSRKRRSRSPRARTPSPRGYDRAMDAQERLARRLERARELMKRKEELKNKDDREQLEKVGMLSANDRVQEAVRRATQLVSSATSSMSEETQDSLTAQISAQVVALKAKALADTGIEVPSYYNPLAVNPISYAQQAAKRKKLWAKKDQEETNNVAVASAGGSSAAKNAMWSSVKFGDDKSNEKFAKLMGIKGDKFDESVSGEASEILKKRAEVFQNLDLQYQQARITTHTQRGLGLGFSSSMIDPNAAQTSQPSSLP